MDDFNPSLDSKTIILFLNGNHDKNINKVIILFIYRQFQLEKMMI